MESHYKPNPYHNSTHAADVLHATAYLVKQLQDKLALHGVNIYMYTYVPCRGRVGGKGRRVGVGVRGRGGGRLGKGGGREVRGRGGGR